MRAGDVFWQVQPIMRRRQWRVPLVSEFYPSNPALLGLNVGGGGGRTQQIKIRLRTPGSIDNFFPFEHILGEGGKGARKGAYRVEGAGPGSVARGLVSAP